MEVFKEVSISATKYISDIVLDNGVTIRAMEDGSADGSDGCQYYAVSKIVNDEIIVLGWSKDTKKPVHL